MKVVALISGGKDSSFNMMQCIAAGHQIVALANLVPHSKTEIDSYMYQSVGHEAIDLIASAMDLPLYKEITLGESSQRGKLYEPTENDEVEDLYKLLKNIQNDIEFEAVSVGAILSDYQRVRVENVCIRLGLIPLAYLWQQDQKELLNEMIKCEVDAIVIKVAALGLDPDKHLGHTLSSLLPYLHSMHEKYGLNVCGEGGEYESLTLDCPLFKSRIVVDEYEKILHTNDPIAPVGYLKLKKMHLENKLPILDLNGRLANLPLKNSYDYILDCIEKIDDCTKENINQKLVVSKLEKFNKQKTVSTRSPDGWLWIGGIQGKSLDSAEAMKEAMEILKSTLQMYDHTIQDVCSITMFISDMAQYADLNRVYCDTFNYANPPTRACIEVPLSQDCPIILQSLSWSLPLNYSGDNPIERYTMHVQSRSHWAPANIGPYSQTVRIEEFIYLAGQIGLIPGSLEIIDGGIRSQCQLTLRHVERLLKAVDPNVNLRDVVQSICYVTDSSYIEEAREIWEGKTNNAIVDYIVVTRLPRDAMIEWHVWAHRHNSQFEYEEKGECSGDYTISTFRRWNYENNIAAIVCHVDSLKEIVFKKQIFIQAIEHTIEKLQEGHKNKNSSTYNLTIFYSIKKIISIDLYSDYMNHLVDTLPIVYTIVPVLCLKSSHTYMSICGIRNQ